MQSSPSPVHQPLGHDVSHKVSRAAEVFLRGARDEKAEIAVARVAQAHEAELLLGVGVRLLLRALIVALLLLLLLLRLLLLLPQVWVLVCVWPEVLGVLVFVLDVLLEDLAAVDGGGAAVAALNAVGGTGSGNLVK